MHSSLASGVTLFEVLLSLILLSIVLLGLDVMELEALHLSWKAYFASLAEQQLENMEERLRMLERQEGLEQESEAWNQENHRLFPQGTGEISGRYPDYTITLYWGEKERKRAECISEHFML